jgi:hypothetical protein
MSRFETAGPIFNGVCECPPYMTKEFTFQQTFAQGATIDPDKGARGATTQIVHGPGDKFLSGPRLPKE